MEDMAQKRHTTAFINTKSPLMDILCEKLTASSVEIVFRSENIGDGLSQLSTFKMLPDTCVIDLDFNDHKVLLQLEELKEKYPSLKLIAHSDIDEEKTVTALFRLGFSAYLLIGSDSDEFQKAFEAVNNGKRYFSLGLADVL